MGDGILEWVRKRRFFRRRKKMFTPPFFLNTVTQPQNTGILYVPIFSHGSSNIIKGHGDYYLTHFSSPTFFPSKEKTHSPSIVLPISPINKPQTTKYDESYFHVTPPPRSLLCHCACCTNHLGASEFRSRQGSIVDLLQILSNDFDPKVLVPRWCHL